METAKLKKFAQFARRSLIEQVSVKLKLVLSDDSAARRESVGAVERLAEAIRLHGEAEVIERVAYIWFNRFCALRFMDVNRFTRIGVVSPADGQVQPEILSEAKMGHIDEEMIDSTAKRMVFSLLDGKSPSRDPQGEAYRLLVVSTCNHWHQAMPFLFEFIDDYTELLMPDDLLSGSSILAYTREAMTPDLCQDVEVIGWLYQFYISEKKDQVFEGLKKNKKITPEKIPAATQLFTPHWIVRYLVENSLGRLWMLNRPNSRLVEKMDYYIRPEMPETDFLIISKPEEIKICDPACGSGHMLTYAFDLLYAIYEEEGHEASEIPEKILTHNLYGIEIDKRAGDLAAFALTMKARAKQRHFFRKPVQPNICVLENIKFDADEIKEYMDFVGRDLFTAPLQTTLHQFEEANNFGSLIRPAVTDVVAVRAILESKNVSGQLFLGKTHQKVLRALKQADYLSPKYHVVVANPPYMGGKGMNGRLGEWSKSNFPESKSDLFAMFMVRSLALTKMKGNMAMINMQSWMFLSSFEKLRNSLLANATLLTMAHLGARAFDSISGEVVSTTAFVFKNSCNSKYRGGFLRLVDGANEAEKDKKMLIAAKDFSSSWFYRASADDFKKIPGSPIAYWLSSKVLKMIAESKKLGDIADARMGLATGNNARYVRFWFEVSFKKIGLQIPDRETAKNCQLRWFPYCKGGAFKKWFGNNEHIVDWMNDGKELQTTLHPSGSRIWAHNFNLDHIFEGSLTWTDITSGRLSVRYNSNGFLFDGSGTSAFFKNEQEKLAALGFLNTQFANEFSKVLNPTLHFQTGDFRNMPFRDSLLNEDFIDGVRQLVDIAKVDWNSFETSWEFSVFPLLKAEFRGGSLLDAFKRLRTYWLDAALQMKHLEEKNGKLFIEKFSLDELSADVPLSEISLICNPHYRYGTSKNQEQLEGLLLADTMREFISYAVGCMLGRFALDNPGLILANQGETFDDYLKLVPKSSFQADKDNVLPILDGEWFSDDIANRFRKFLRVTFGEEHYEENVSFIEESLGKNGKPLDIRDYFVKEFYNDHLKRYKKRPIYWLFSSPKGTFNALIYMHRYRPDTVSVVLNDYLREFRTKLTAHKGHLDSVSSSASASQSEKTKAIKETEKLKKAIVELEEYEREVLYPLATKQVEINLDDGVKVNYLKFGAALKKIPGLDANED